MSGAKPTPEPSVEEIWRERLAAAERRYHDAVRDLARAGEGSNEISDASVAAAAERKAAARQEYLAVLRVFTNLIVRGIVPEADPTRWPDDGPQTR